MRKKCVLIGAGSRITFQYALPLYQHYRQQIQLVGILDTNQGRAALLNARLDNTCRTYTDFSTMVKAEAPDLVIIGSPDATHHEYIVQALEQGLEVICEKPITTDAAKGQLILDAERKTGRNIVVTFNYRFTAFATRIKQLIRESGIGRLHSVHLEWHLDRQHGADYFRRWHSLQRHSGGLLVHKSTHHFDLVNWLLDDEPEQVHAFGGLKVYGRANAPFFGTNCRTCPHAARCEFYRDFSADEFIRDSFFGCEAEDHYLRDRCVYSDQIDIVDTASVQVRYKKQTVLSYSLNAYSPYEGYHLFLTGENGRIEAEDFHGLVGPFKGEQRYGLRYYNKAEEVISIQLAPQTGSHGGGDDRMMKMLFGGLTEDPWGHLAGSRSGLMSALIGIAANESIRTGAPQTIASLVEFA
jgi:hypothetical protein